MHSDFSLNPYSNYLEVAGGLSAVNVFGTQLRGLIKLGLTRWRLTGYMDSVAESGRNPVSKYTRYCLGVDNERAGVGRDGRTRFARSKSQAQTGRG